MPAQWRNDDAVAAGLGGGQRAADQEPAGAADRDAAGPAGAAGEGVQRPPGTGQPARPRARCRGAGRLRHGGARRRVQELARQIVDSYDGDAARVWATAATGDELARRIGALPGFGPAKARITVALLGKQLGVRPRGWREAAGAFGEPGSHYSVADITDDKSLAAVRAHKKQLKAAAKAR